MAKVSKSVIAKATAALHALMAEEKGDRIQVPGGVFAHDGTWYPAGNGLWATAAGVYRGVVDGQMVYLSLAPSDEDPCMYFGLIGPKMRGRLHDVQRAFPGCRSDKLVKGSRAKILEAARQRGEEYGMPNLYAAVKAIFKHWKTVGSVEDRHAPVQ
jgi:hypothetical protein